MTNYATRCYGQMVPVRHMIWDNIDQDAVMNMVSSQHYQTFPPSRDYARNYLKKVIADVEENGDEVREELLETYINLLQAKEGEAACYKTYYTDIGVITLREESSLISHGTTGLRTWEAALRFAEYILANKELVKGCRVLELGSGVGFLGILSARLGAIVTMTDLDHRVLEQCRKNVELNGVEANVQQLDWENIADNIPDFDIIIGADIVYDPEIIVFLAKTLATLLRTDKVAYLASTIRNPSTWQAFEQATKQNGLLLYDIPLHIPEVFIHEEAVDTVKLLRIEKNTVQI